MVKKGRRLNPAAFNEWVWKRLTDYSHRQEVYYGGAGSGKSYGAAQKVLLKAMNRRRKVLVVRKVGVTLRDSQRAYFYRQLDGYEPGLSQRYRRTYGERYFCPIPNYREIIPLFEGECRTQGLLCRMSDIIEASRAPYRREQMRFF